MDMVADVEMIEITMLLARAMVIGVNVDVMGGELTRLGSRALSLLNKPHD